MNHSATTLDAIYVRYEEMSQEYANNRNIRWEIVKELKAKADKTPEELEELNQERDDWRYFDSLYKATCRKMLLVQQLSTLEEQFPTSAFL